MLAPTLSKISLLALLCCSYALTRYIFVGDVSPNNIPAFISNKALAVFCIGAWLFGAISCLQEKRSETRYWFRLGWQAACLHIGLSMVLLSPAYYSKLYEGPTLNWQGELLLLLGVIAAWAYWRYGNRLNYRPWILAITCAHIANLSSSWWTPEAWPAYMPPISLISCCLLLVAIRLSFKARKKAK